MHKFKYFITYITLFLIILASIHELNWYDDSKTIPALIAGIVSAFMADATVTYLTQGENNE